MQENRRPPLRRGEESCHRCKPQREPGSKSHSEEEAGLPRGTQTRMTGLQARSGRALPPATSGFWSGILQRQWERAPGKVLMTGRWSPFQLSEYRSIQGCDTPSLHTAISMAHSTYSPTHLVPCKGYLHTPFQRRGN